MEEGLEILDEPAGEEYANLIDLIASYAAAFSLVWRDQLEFDSQADTIGKRLVPYLIREDYTSVWPWTKLLGHKAWVRRYRIENGSLSILKKSPSLYAWIGPSRPEDLAFYGSAGECLLGSIAHERYAWVRNEAIGPAIARQIPTLRLAPS